MSHSEDQSSEELLADPLAQAEAEAAEAEARAVAARARAAELRDLLTETETETEPETEPETGAAVASAAPPARARLLLQALALVLAGLATAGLLGASGWMLRQHHLDSEHRRLSAEYAAAARQGVINLMSVDYTSARETVQRVLDGSTGRFKSGFSDASEDFVKALEEEKIITKATVNDAAVESLTADSAVVLVSATSRREGPEAPEDQKAPRQWRVVMTLEREDGQIKVSAVEFT